MICSEEWSFRHYKPFNNTEKIIVDQVVPKKDAIAITWTGGQKKWVVNYRIKGSDYDFNTITVNETKCVITDLIENTDYEFFVECDGDKGRLGFARTGYVPGVVVNYLHPDDTKYAFSGQHLCTPSILKHPDGYLLASMDVFEGGAPQNLTLIFRSDDNGGSWYHYTELFPCFWGTLFLHNNDVYMLATSTEYGDLIIGKSFDGGLNWDRPTVLARGACHKAGPGWHKSSMPVIEHAGRLWCGVDYGSHLSGGHTTSLVSADASKDLLDASNWTISEPLKFSDEWEGASKGDTRGFIEGNAVVFPDGEIGNMLRYLSDLGEPKYGFAGLLRGHSNEPERSLQPYKFVCFRGNLSKFDVKKDEESGFYFSIFSRIKDGYSIKMRNLLSLACSPDLENWNVLCDLIDYSDEDPKKIGFQYVSFCFDGNDIIYLSRTAFNEAQNYHDNNYITFHRIENFRDMLHKEGKCDK